jgi:uncharacterized protein YjiS (DUF1127 family)
MRHAAYANFAVLILLHCTYLPAVERKQSPKPGTVRSTYQENIMFEVLKTRITAWKRYSRTVSELNALTNRELADLGIARADIQRVAREAAR